MDDYLLRLSQNNFDVKDINALVVEIGGWFLGTPYKEKTLELPGEERLVVDMMGLDCTTYLETVVTLARLGNMGRYSFEDYSAELEFLRYIDGNKGEYPTRLHYFSDWIADNEVKNILKDITADIGGIPYVNRPSFMSSNPKFYAQLSNPKFVDKMKARERVIGARDYHYVPKSEIGTVEESIEAGDLIAITATMDNLDVVHVGFAVKRNGRTYLMHASSMSRMVEISEKPLSDYLATNKSQSGIIVARLIGTAKK